MNFVQYLIHFGLTGIFQNSASQDTCLPCASGKFSAVGSIACATCLAGNIIEHRCLSCFMSTYIFIGLTSYPALQAPF